VTIDYSKAV